MEEITSPILVKNLSSQTVDLMEEYKGKPMLLLFYNNSCLGCTGRAIPLAYEFQQKYTNIQVIGVHSNFGRNITTAEDIMSIFTISELPFPIYIDEDHKMYDYFKSEGTPFWVLITSNKQLYRSIFGSQEGAQNRLYYALEALETNIEG